MVSVMIDRRAGLSSATAMKGPCRAATTANVTLAGLQTIDGVSLVAGDRVLVKDQTDATENGIRIVDTGDWARAKDFSRNDDVVKGTRVAITDGTVNASGTWQVDTESPITFDTDDIDFVFVERVDPADIINMTEASALTGAELVHVVQLSNNRKTTVGGILEALGEKPVTTTGVDFLYGMKGSAAVVRLLPSADSVVNHEVDPTGAVDCATALATARTAILAKGVPLFVPAGSYLSGGTTYVVEGNGFLWLDASFSGGVDILGQARAANILLTGETPNTTPNAVADNRTLLSTTLNAKGDQHGNSARFNLNNYSTYTGGNTAIYCAAVNADTQAWGAAVHGETKHGNAGSSIAGNFEAASYGATGNLYGIVINQSTSGAATTHPITGAAKANATTATAALITGDRTFGASQVSAWRIGIDVHVNAMRNDGIALRFNGPVDTLIKSETGAISTTADIFLQGNSGHGIVLSGTYTNAAIRINSGQYIAMEATDTIKTAHGVTANVWGFYNGANERVGLVMTATPAIRIATNQVLTGRKTGWGNPSGTLSRAAYAAYAGQNVSAAYVEAEAQATDDALKLLSQTVAALITDLHSATSGHGMIGT